MIIFWLAYCVITLYLLYIIHKVDRHYHWCQHNFKAIKDAMKGQLLLNDFTREMIHEVNDRVEKLNKKGGKNVKKK